MKLKTLSMSAAAVAMIAGGALAQDTTADPETAPMPEDMAITNDTNVAAPLYTDIEDMTVGDVLSMIAYDPNGERIGDIDYVVEGLNGAEIVVGIGGFLGLGEYTVALPIEEFDLNSEGTGFVVNTDKERLEQLPEFDESNAESLPDDVMIATLIEEEPTTDDSATDDSATEDSATEDSATDDSATDEPMTEEPVTEDPVTEEDPANDESSTQ